MGKIIGITGGIGAGKSTVSAILRDKGFQVVDADAISRRMTEKGSPALAELADALGPEILTEDGMLNRQLTADIVFNDSDKKSILEKIITDRVFSVISEKANTHRHGSSGLLFLDVPLLFETDAWKLCDEIWFVTADIETRIARVCDREHCSRQAVLDRIAAQLPEEVKRRRSDQVIDNSGDLDTLDKALDIALESEN
jgi:dephospho-CoA kinase